MTTILHKPATWHHYIPSELSSLNDVEVILEKIHKEAEMSEDQLPNFLVAVIEAISNAILHGNRQDPHKLVELQVMRHAEHVEVLVRDQGEGFDATQLPEPTADEYILNESGRGIFLMRHLSDGVEFLEGGRCVRLIFKV